MRISFLTLALLCAIAGPARAAISGQDLLQGRALTVESGKRGTVVVFLSVKCPCSNSHLARIRQLVKDYPAFAFVLVHSNSDEPAADAAAYFRKADLGAPVLQDEKSRLADQFKALKTPHAFVLSPSGEILYRGGVTNSANGETADRQILRSALEDLTSGKAVQTPASRTLGCVIAR
ncbi:MAG: redoxin domain-containing protein [Bdellovibrionota bacterium]